MSQIQKINRFVDEWKKLNPRIPKRILKRRVIAETHYKYSAQGITRRLNGGKLGLRKREILAKTQEV